MAKLTCRAVPRCGLHALVLQTSGLYSADDEAEHAQLAYHFIKRSFSDEEFFRRIRWGQPMRGEIVGRNEHTKSVKGCTRNHKAVAFSSGRCNPIFLGEFVGAY